MLLKLMALFSAVVHMVSPQGTVTNVLQQAESDAAQSVIVTSKTRAFLSCESGDMVVKVNFTQPFRGLIYAHRSRNSPCRVTGDGGNYYELRIPLKGCGTWQDSPRVFMNNITIRFHSALELEEDETKTIVCRYPPPLTPAPGSINVVNPVTASPSPGPSRAGAAKLSEVEILIIICLLLFLSLVTLGIGIAYFCLKRRNIRIVRKALTSRSSSPPSQLTKLSSSRLPSSLLGHTVRIPRAVPYSAPSSRLAAPVSESSSESSGSSQTTEEGVDGARHHLLFRKAGSKSLLSIPKAILRKNGFKSRAVPAVHQRSGTFSRPYSPRVTETEDQVVTTVLEPENNIEEDVYYAIGRSDSMNQNERIEDQGLSGYHKAHDGDDGGVPSVPVYAQVDKSKKRSHFDDAQQQSRKRSPLHWSIRAINTPGTAKRHEIITEVPEELKTTEEVTKNTTVTTSFRKEITETRHSSPVRLTDNDGNLGTSPEIQPALHPSSEHPPKNILIQEVADIYVTTTVETELRESKTTISRDSVEEHARTTPDTPDAVADKTEVSPSENWNVVIRQRKPTSGDSSPMKFASNDGDRGSGERVNSEDSDSIQAEKPHFDVTIRTIRPSELKPKKIDTMMSIPHLEIPKSVNRLKEALNPPKPDADSSDSRRRGKPLARTKTKFGQRTVRWFDDTKDIQTIPEEEESSITSSDSFRSEESLRERSSSEVLEVVPTLPGHRRTSDHPMLERSTSEMSPDDHVRWVGGVVPVLENLSPEFLANIPVVSQGGFFSRDKPHSPQLGRDQS